MLLYTKRAPPKAPKKRSRAGCMHWYFPISPNSPHANPSSTAKKRSAEPNPLHDTSNSPQKKKCNEKRPQCDRCSERNLQCEYEAIKPRKRRRTSFAGSAVSQGTESRVFNNERWPGRREDAFSPRSTGEGFNKWEAGSASQYPESEASTLEWDNAGGMGEDVEEVEREPYSSTAIVRSRSQYPDLAMIAPSPAGSPLLEFSAPVFEEFTGMRNRRALVDHFCNVLSHLIVFKEDTGNPFRQLVLPLSHGSSPVLNAIFALSSAHLEYRGIENEEKSLDFHNKALQGLAMLIEQNEQANRDEVLGAIILLVYYEVLVQRGDSNIVNGHLKGAMAIMKSGPKVSTPATQFLERAFRFYDVIAALSLGTAPNTTNLTASNPLPIAPASPLPSSPLGSVDTLLGLSTDLWPIIHRLSHLLPYKNLIAEAVSAGLTSKAAVLRTELETTSQAIEHALTNWKPSLISEEYPNSPDSDGSDAEDARMASILNNAEAYRHSAFIYLFRTVRGYSRAHPVVQRHTSLSLQACTEVVIQAEKCHDGPMSALLWPLFVASCEAVSDVDRERAREAFGGIERRQGMRNIARAWEVVGEVWRRGDAGEGDVEWKEVCEEMGYNIVFG